MAQIVTKKCIALDDNSLEMLMSMCISYKKTPLNTNRRKRKIKWYLQMSFIHNNKIVLLNNSVI